MAAIATVVTLIYLAAQVRANTRSAAIDSHRYNSSMGSESVIAIANNGELAEIFNRGVADLGTLDEVELTRFSFIVSEFVIATQSSFMESTETRDSTYSASNASALYFFRAPGGREWWRKNSFLFTPEFVSWLDEALELDSRPARQGSTTTVLGMSPITGGHGEPRRAAGQTN